MLYKIGTTEDPKEYNRKIAEFCTSGKSSGCVSARACEGCSAIIADSICLCSPSFTCPECNFENGVEYKKMIASFKQYDFNQNINILNKFNVYPQ